MISEETTRTLIKDAIERGAECLATMRVARELNYAMIIGGATDEQKDRDGYAEDLAIAALVAASGGVSANYISSRVDYHQDNILRS